MRPRYSFSTSRAESMSYFGCGGEGRREGGREGGREEGDREAERGQWVGGRVLEGMEGERKGRSRAQHMHMYMYMYIYI